MDSSAARPDRYNEPMRPSSPDRRRIAAAAVLLQVCLGVIYAWGVFRRPLEEHYGWSKSESIAPYRWSILFSTLAMIPGGFWQDRKGPRMVATAGGLLLASGCALAAAVGSTPMGLNLAYGVLGGLGVGLAYVTPVATCVQWFPDRRGMMVGLAVMGFGSGALLFAPLLERLLGQDAAQFGATIPRTFLLLAGLFLLAIPACARWLTAPPPGWLPPGWVPPPAARETVDMSPRAMLQNGWFYCLWILFYLGSGVGLTAFGESAPLVGELAGSSAVLSGGAAIGLMSLFNGLGRLSWGALSDRTGRRLAVRAMSILSALACGLLVWGHKELWIVLGGLCAVGFTFGGYLAVMPALTAEYFGSAHIGANYGLMFTAWGLAGFTVPRWTAAALEQHRAAGDPQGGYQQFFLTLAALAISAALVSLLLRPASVPRPPSPMAAAPTDRARPVNR